MNSEGCVWAARIVEGRRVSFERSSLCSRVLKRELSKAGGNVSGCIFEDHPRQGGKVVAPGCARLKMGTFLRSPKTTSDLWSFGSMGSFRKVVGRRHGMLVLFAKHTRHTGGQEVTVRKKICNSIFGLHL